MCKVAYTVGNRISYDQALATRPFVTKFGPRPEDFYEGGWVWIDPEEARAYIETRSLPFEAKVYGLLLPNGWNEDVSKAPGPDGVHHLLNDAQVVQVKDLPGGS